MVNCKEIIVLHDFAAARALLYYFAQQV